MNLRRLLANSTALREVIIAGFAVAAGLGVITNDQLPDQMVALVVAIATCVSIVTTDRSTLPKSKVVSYVQEVHPYSRLYPGPAKPAGGYSDQEIADISRRTGES